MSYRRCLFVWIYLVTVIARDMTAIKCWQCSSSDSKLCGDFLDHTNFTDIQRSWHLVRCGAVRKKFDYKGDKMIAKCMMRIDLAYEKLVYTRKCVEEAENSDANSCLTDESFHIHDDPNIIPKSCETCTEKDGCNNFIKNYFSPEMDSSSLGNKGLLQPIVVFCLLITLISYQTLY